MSRLFRIWALGAALLLALTAGAATRQVEPLLLFNREIVELRAVLGGLSPAERAQRAQARFATLSDAERLQPLQLQPMAAAEQHGLTLTVGDKPLFTLLEADLDPEEQLGLRPAAERAQRRVQGALDARRAQSDPALWLHGAAVTAGVLLAWVALWWGAGRLQRVLDRLGPATAGEDRAAPATYVRLFVLRVLSAAAWLLVVALSFATVLLLDAFPWTASWGDRLTLVVWQLGGWLVGGIMAAVPGLLTVVLLVLLVLLVVLVVLVVLVARAVQDALALFMRHVHSGRLRVPFLHPESAGATRRLLNLLVWVLALAVAYPFLPGSDSDAFKGLSVLFGLMITLGSTGVVTQLMSGLVVVYSRSLKRGDFVAVAGIEGVVSEVGALAVKVTTLRNEEIALPNTVITGSAVHNYSKLGDHQGTLVSTGLTIGYDTPWRQVHAMLTAAALLTPGLRQVPPPFVYQRALSDFNVEYELFVHTDRPLERVPILSALHAAILDQFNTHGVQIMSPHFYDQPGHAVLVPPAKWYAAPARPPQDGSSPAAQGTR